MSTQKLLAARVALFFEQFLPKHIGSLGLEEMGSFSITFGFVIDDLDDAHWVFRFEHGMLVGSIRVSSGISSDEAFCYHLNQDAFWEVVGGQVDPRAVFLGGRAEIAGDTEQALKVGMILAQFSRKHPYPKNQPVNIGVEESIDG